MTSWRKRVWRTRGALGFGAVLLQKRDDGKLHPVFYFSKRTTADKAKLHSLNSS